jgi:hypothetical protein
MPTATVSKPRERRGALLYDLRGTLDRVVVGPERIGSLG